MSLNRSPWRLAAVAAFLFSFALVAPAAAQTTTPYANECFVQLSPGDAQGDCTTNVRAGKRCVIESATVGGSMNGLP